MDQKEKIELPSLIQYAFLALPLGFSGFPLYILAPDFYAITYYGILNLLSKSSFAFASALSFFILDYAEFKVGGKNLSTSLMGLSIAYALIPCIIKITAAFFVWKIFIKFNSEKINEDI